ncbi:hypothetical protein GCM10027512_02940 [Chromohalobacter beijerinckii]
MAHEAGSGEATRRHTTALEELPAADAEAALAGGLGGFSSQSHGYVLSSGSLDRLVAQGGVEGLDVIGFAIRRFAGIGGVFFFIRLCLC